MRDIDDATYYLGRAEQEEEAARLTTNAMAAKIHNSLAERYRITAYERQRNEDGQRLRLVRD